MNGPGEGGQINADESAFIAFKKKRKQKSVVRKGEGKEKAAKTA